MSPNASHPYKLACTQPQGGHDHTGLPLPDARAKSKKIFWSGTTKAKESTCSRFAPAFALHPRSGMHPSSLSSLFPLFFLFFLFLLLLTVVVFFFFVQFSSSGLVVLFGRRRRWSRASWEAKVKWGARAAIIRMAMRTPRRARVAKRGNLQASVIGSGGGCGGLGTYCTCFGWR